MKKLSFGLVSLLLILFLQVPLFAEDVEDAAPEGDGAATSETEGAEGESAPVASGGSGVGVPDFEVYAQGVYLYNLDTETLIYERNSGQKMAPASLTKIMTCILALEMTENLDATILTYPNYVQDWLYDYQYIQGHGAVSSGGLMAGERLPMRQMLYALMLPSANEAAMVIADHLGGDGGEPSILNQEKFAEMMNAKARQIGCRNTNFVTPNGLPEDDHYTTPYDMYLITRYAMEVPGFMEIVSSTKQVYGPTNLHSSLTWNTTNQMMVETSSYYYPAIRGIKTGTLEESGRCFVSTATRDGFTYLLVVMGSPISDNKGLAYAQNLAFVDSANLYDWVFDTFRNKSLVEKGKYLTEIELNLSLEKDHLQLMTADRFSALVHVDVEPSSVQMVYNIPEAIDAPVEKGDKIGTVTLMLSGSQLGEIDLLAAETVSASTVLVLLEKVKAIFRSFLFKFIVIFLLLLIGAYIALMIVRNRNRQRGYKPRRRL